MEYHICDMNFIQDLKNSFLLQCIISLLIKVTCAKIEAEISNNKKKKSEKQGFAPMVN